MKIQILLLNAAIFCLLVGTSGVAMAQVNTCPGGVLNNQTVEGTLRVIGQSCQVQGVTIRGNVVVNNLGVPDAIFIMKDTTVDGGVKIEGGRAIIDKSIIATLRLRVLNTIQTLVADTLVAFGDVVFRDNLEAFIYRNVVGFGDIRCVDNQIGRPRQFARDNLTPFGDIRNCFGQ